MLSFFCLNEWWKVSTHQERASLCRHIPIGKRLWHRCTNTTDLKPLGWWSNCKHCVWNMLPSYWVVRCKQPLCEHITTELTKLCMKEESHKLRKSIKNKIIRSRQPSTSYIVSNGGKSRWQLCDILVTMPQVNISTRKIKIHLVYQMIILRRKSLWTKLKPPRLCLVQGSAK